MLRINEILDSGFRRNDGSTFNQSSLKRKRPERAVFGFVGKVLSSAAWPGRFVIPGHYSTISAFVLSMNSITSLRSCCGSWNFSSVAFKWPMNFSQSLSLTPIPLWDVLLSRPVYNTGPPALEQRKSINSCSSRLIPSSPLFSQKRPSRESDISRGRRSSTTAVIAS